MLADLDKPFIKTSYHVTVKILKKFLQEKFSEVKSFDDVKKKKKNKNKN